MEHPFFFSRRDDTLVRDTDGGWQRCWVQAPYRGDLLANLGRAARFGEPRNVDEGHRIVRYLGRYRRPGESRTQKCQVPKSFRSQNSAAAVESRRSPTSTAAIRRRTVGCARRPRRSTTEQRSRRNNPFRSGLQWTQPGHNRGAAALLTAFGYLPTRLDSRPGAFRWLATTHCGGGAV